MHEVKRSSLIRHLFVSGVILASIGALAAISASSQTTVKPSVNREAKSAESYGKLPLAFEANHGQADPSVKFLSRGNGYSLFLTDSDAVLALGRADCKASANEREIKADKCSAMQDIARMKLVGASARQAAIATGEAELPGKVNYFIGNDLSKWHSDLPTFAKVRYSRVYPGIDLVYYGSQGQLEYDFVVAPGTSAAAIRLSFTGEKNLSIAANGDLVLHGEHGSAIFHKPLVYQEKNGRRQPVAGSFRLMAKNTVRFTVGSYNRAEPLIIDPVLVYSTYLGGSGNTNHQGDQGNGIAVDSAGNVYVVGTTYSADFPVTSGAFQSINRAANSASTVFISKLNAAGTALVYSTYLGGSGGDFGYGIALDPAGNAYVTGATYSTDFPVTCGAYQTTNPSSTSGATTAFVAKLNVDGNNLFYSTYLGGRGNRATPAHGDAAQAIVVNSTGDAYVTGYTWSANFPVTDNAFQGTFAGNAANSNAFVSELTPRGTGLVYSTFLGGSGADYGNGVALDAAGDVFVAGSTNSSDFPVTKGVFQAALNGPTNAFVTELNPDGSDEVFSTYLGGGGDSAQAIAVDSKGFTYVAGSTNSSTFPLTAGAVEGTNFTTYELVDSGTGFITKLSQDASSLVYSTYVQGHNTIVTGLAVDSTGAAYLTGSASSVGAGYWGGFESTPDGLPVPPSQANSATSGNSAFVVKLDPLASMFNYATLLGGGANDRATALAIDSSGNIYVTGYANSADFPTTSGAFQTMNHAPAVGAGNAFVSKFALAAEANQTVYPDFPTDLGLTMSIADEGLVWDCNGGYFVFVTLRLDENVPGPPPTGEIDLNGDFAVPDYVEFNGSWGGSTQVLLVGASANGGPPAGSASWTALYYGDQFYPGSSIGDTVYSPTCNTNDISDTYRLKAQSSQNKLNPAEVRDYRSSHSALHLTLTRSDRARSTSAVSNVSGPKFIPPVITSPANRDVSSATPDAQSYASAVCVSPVTPLTITVKPAAASRRYGVTNPQLSYTITGLHSGDTIIVTPQTTATAASPVGTYPITATVTGPSISNYNITVVDGTLTVTPAPLTVTLRSVPRLYGAANPVLGYFTTGLINGDTVTVTESTTATPSSPVGAYPITATITGLALSNYALTVIPGTLYVRPAPLYISASNVASRYGQTPPQPTAYKLTGFVNGDTAAIVSGAPILSTTVTATTPAGLYKIGVQVGTLTAHNYVFETYSSGEGSVNVLKAPLQLKANNLTMTQGSVVPTLTYTLTGFVNGQSAAGTVSGAPILSTTATSASAPGHYPININPGTLNSTNYFFQSVNGVMTVSP